MLQNCLGFQRNLLTTINIFFNVKKYFGIKSINSIIYNNWIRSVVSTNSDLVQTKLI